MGSKTLHQQNPPVLNWRCLLTQVYLYNGHKMGDWLVGSYVSCSFKIYSRLGLPMPLIDPSIFWTWHFILLVVLNLYTLAVCCIRALLVVWCIVTYLLAYLLICFSKHLLFYPAVMLRRRSTSRGWLKNHYIVCVSRFDLMLLLSPSMLYCSGN